MASEWTFLVDECVDPDVAYGLESERIRAEAVRDILWPGADDFDDILPYAKEQDSIIVTSDITDYGSLEDADHEGIVLIYDNELATDRIIEGLQTIVDQYPSRNDLRAYEKLDPWVSNL